MMDEPKYKYHYDLSPLKEAYCPYCTSDGHLYVRCDIVERMKEVV